MANERYPFRNLVFQGGGMKMFGYHGALQVIDNFPLELFDEPDHVYDEANFVDGINRETLGCRLFTPDHCQDPKEIETLTDYLVRLFYAITVAEDIAYANKESAQARTVEISNCCVNAPDFDLQPVAKDERYCALLEAGRQAMQEYLTAYGQIRTEAER